MLSWYFAERAGVPFSTVLSPAEHDFAHHGKRCVKQRARAAIDSDARWHSGRRGMVRVGSAEPPPIAIALQGPNASNDRPTQLAFSSTTLRTS